MNMIAVQKVAVVHGEKALSRTTSNRTITIHNTYVSFQNATRYLAVLPSANNK